MRYLSLFSGLEGASLAWRPLGWTCVAVAETDPACCAVLDCRWPGIPNLGDVRKITEGQVKGLGHIDLVVFGSPCQDVSIAGKRAGMGGKRSGLFFRAIDILRWSRAEWFVFENVPGLLNSHDGDDMRAVLECFEDLGYVVDVDILDAQWFGVPQRRRRIFACGQSAGCIASRRTSSSRLTIVQCLSEISRLILEGSGNPSCPGPARSGLPGDLSDGLRRRMKLFGLQSESDCLKGRANLEDALLKFPPAPGGWASTGAGATDCAPTRGERFSR